MIFIWYLLVESVHLTVRCWPQVKLLLVPWLTFAFCFFANCLPHETTHKIFFFFFWRSGGENLSGQCVTAACIILVYLLISLEVNVEHACKSLQQVCKALVWLFTFICVLYFCWHIVLNHCWKNTENMFECRFQLPSPIPRDLIFISLLGTLSDMNVGFFSQQQS